MIKKLYNKWNAHLDSKLYYEFLPSKMELLETPSPFLSHLILKTVYCLIIISFLICFFGDVDIVAVSQGKIIPTGNVKIIQPLNTSIVKNIHVKEGQEVKKGDLLISLDSVDFSKDLENYTNQRDEKLVTLARLKATVDNKEFVNNNYPESLFVREKDIFDSEISEYKSNVESFFQEIAKVTQQILKQDALIKALKDRMPMLKDKYKVYKKLLDEKIASKSQAYRYIEEYLESKQNLIAMKEEKKELINSKNSLISQKESKISEFMKNKYMELNKVQSELAQLNKQIERLSTKSNQQDLTSPIDGKVTQLNVHTIGGVVSSAQELMKVVPFDKELIAEVMISNKDIGFIRANQEVNVKLDAFPFTKYGIIPGEVLDISQDAIIDERLGLLFKSRIKINQQYIQVNGAKIHLIPGMSLSAEVKTGKRRLIEFFMSPIMKHMDESLRER